MTPETAAESGFEERAKADTQLVALVGGATAGALALVLPAAGLALAGFEGVITRSDGEGDDRRVQIIPVRRAGAAPTPS